MKFLFVDDDESILLFLDSFLSAYAVCREAQNGEEAISAFDQALAEGEPFTAVFMDILMPGMDGNQVVRELRRLERDKGADGNRAFKLIMISICTDTKNVSDSFFYGLADAYIPKPLRPEILMRELRKLGLIPAPARSGLGSP